MPPIESIREKKEIKGKPIVTSTWERLLEKVAIGLAPERFTGIKIVLGVSGGADSVAMFRLVFDLWNRSPQFDPCHLVIAHFNHKLRGLESDADQDFTRELARSFQLAIHTQDAPTDCLTAMSAGGEAAFRASRYRFLQQTAEILGARCVLVAHTADDNIETMLHHLFRGTGPAGLAAMAPYRPLGDEVVLHRPLLSLRRTELRAGLEEIRQNWREDASNLDSRYQRNWLRNELLPMIRNRYPSADDAILRTIESQSQYREKLDADAASWIEEHVVCQSNTVTIKRGQIDIATLCASVRILWDRMRWPRQSITELHLRRIHIAVTCSHSVRFTLPTDIQCNASENQVVLTRGRQATGMELGR